MNEKATPASAPALPQLRYSAKIFGPGFPTEGKVVEEFLADYDTAAVDHVRGEHLEKSLPLEGGEFDIEVSSPDEATVVTDKGPRVRPAGVISRFSVRHEPHPSVAEELREKARLVEAKHHEYEKHDAVLDKLVADGTVTEEQVASKRLLPAEARDGRRKSRAARIAHHRDRYLSAVEALEADGAIGGKAAERARSALTEQLKETGK